MIKAVIFDLDGVLLDNTSVIVEVFQEDARRCGVKVPERKDVISALGLIWTVAVEKLIGEDEKYKEIHRQVWAEYEYKMNLMPNTKETLSRLEQEKAIVTSKSKETAKRQLKDTLPFFKIIVAMEDTEKHKPNPEPLLKACNQLNVEPNEAVYIGDYIRDFEMARNAGTDFIGILSGALSKEEFEKAGVEKTINSLSELPEMISLINKN